jgi:hypothetical protein
MRKITLMLLLAGFALFVSPPVWADNYVEFYMYRGDANHDGTPDHYGAEIEVSVSDATGVQMYVGGSTWVPFANEGGGNFSMLSNVHTSLADLLTEIGGAQQLKILRAPGDSTYSYNIGTNETTIGAAFPADLPVITGVAWAGNQATLSWTWGGNPANVDGLCVEADVQIGGTWSSVYDECSDDIPQVITKSALQAVIDFSSTPGPYDLIKYLVGYGNVADVNGVNGTAITDWTLAGGADLFGGTEDEVTEAFGSGDWLIVPEPATMCLLGLGGIGLLVRRRRS